MFSNVATRIDSVDGVPLPFGYAAAACVSMALSNAGGCPPGKFFDSASMSTAAGPAADDGTCNFCPAGTYINDTNSLACTDMSSAAGGDKEQAGSCVNRHGKGYGSPYKSSEGCRSLPEVFGNFRCSRITRSHIK